MLTIEYAKDPAWNNAEHTSVVLTVKFEEFIEELPFTANPHDVMHYGVELYNRALAREFGPIAPYTPSPFATQPQPISEGAQTL
jgi:hypothetical protein